jgi:hypothetical protein
VCARLERLELGGHALQLLRGVVGACALRPRAPVAVCHRGRHALLQLCYCRCQPLLGGGEGGEFKAQGLRVRAGYGV